MPSRRRAALTPQSSATCAGQARTSVAAGRLTLCSARPENRGGHMTTTEPTQAATGVSWREAVIAIFTIAMIAIHLVLRFAIRPGGEVFGKPLEQLPLLAALVLGGLPLLAELLLHVVRGEFGSDLLVGISIITPAILDEYLAGALAVRMPSVAHRKRDASVTDVPLADVAIGDTLVVFPHEICPVDGTVIEGRGIMDESYLTGEPYMMSKAPGATVLSGAINGDTALTIRADKLAVDSRYAKIMQVMRASEQHRS